MALVIPTALQARNDTIIRHFTDTIETVTTVRDSTLQQREVVIPADSTDRRGHYVQAHLGLGYGSLGYNITDPYSSTTGSFSALLQAQYAYFFHPNWGVGAGLWFTNYTTHARLGDHYYWRGQTDTDLEMLYDHDAHILRWRERETIHNIGIPISLQFQMQKEHWKAGIWASLGVAPSFSVARRYRVLEGEIDHSGYYPAWDLLLTDMHEFGVKDYTNAPCARGELSVRPQVALFADLGATWPVTKQIDILLGGYFNVSLNDANSSTRHPLGWKDATFTFMEEYTGAYSLAGSSSHPWEAGIKVGIHWHYLAPDKHENEPYYEYFTREETSYAYVPRTDTTIVIIPDPEPEPEPEPEEVVPQEEPEPTPLQQVAEEVEKFNKIYFAFDSYALTNKAKFYLSSIVDALNRVPEAKIMLDGHASTEGQDVYNDILSANRARSVANFLISKGVNKDRIVIAGHGSRIPNEDHEREEMKRDRRVEVRVITNETANQ